MTGARFRRMVLALDGASEGAHMGHADFRVAGRVFASLDRDERVGSMHLPPDDQQRWLDACPDVFTPASGAWGRQGWTKVSLAAAEDEAVGEAVSVAIRHARMLAAKAGTRKVATAKVGTVRKVGTKKAAARTVDALKAGTAGKARTTRAQAPGAASGVRAVDEYIAAADPKVRPILEKIRGLVRRLAPAADEVISYRMPAFTLDGMLIFYAPFKAHIGIFPPVKGDAALEADLEPFRGPKGNLRFPLDAKIPYALIGRVVKARIADQRARALIRKRR